MGTNGLVFLYVLFFFKEPRGEVILRKRCKALSKETVRLRFLVFASSPSLPGHSFRDLTDTQP